jgi:peptidoglycan/xylan/chitin deacetylase (PgdA/CDA1 family)
MSPAPWFVVQLLPCGSGSFGRGYRSFVPDGAQAWLTIDDGPDPRTTPAVLARLAAARIRATFFLIGEKARAHPELVAAILEAGHEVANHTASHASARFWSLSRAGLLREIDGGTGPLAPAPVRCFRPPAGIKNPWLAPVLGRLGLTLVLWSARGLDGLNRPAKQSFARIAPQLRPGAIILVHEVATAPERTLEYLDLVVGELAARGLACVVPATDRLRLHRPQGSR